LAAAALTVIGTGVYLLSRSGSGRVPDMPAVAVDDEQLAFALKRLKDRAALPVEADYAERVTGAYYQLNRAESGVDSVDGLNRLMAQFEQTTGIPSTARKERYLLLGDRLAVAFEVRLQKLLAAASQKGLSRLIKSGAPEYLSVVEISGSFVSTMARMNTLREDGTLTVPSYIPQIVFRRRWRMLGGLPYRYQFLPVESLVDSYYLLRWSSPTLVDERVRAAARVKRFVPAFDEILARAIVYHEGGETKKAIALLEAHRTRKANRDVLEQFLRFLKNR